MCNYCNDSKEITTPCNKCWGMSGKDTHDSKYAWHCDKCHGEGCVVIECIYCEK